MPSILPRTDITKLNSQELTSFLKALSKMQSLSLSNSHSYSDLASYHGCPKKCCPHHVEKDGVATVAYHFLPWHRHYIHLFEQALLSAQSLSGVVPSGYPQNVGLPYWDWTQPVTTRLLNGTSIFSVSDLFTTSFFTPSNNPFNTILGQTNGLYLNYFNSNTKNPLYAGNIKIPILGSPKKCNKIARSVRRYPNVISGVMDIDGPALTIDVNLALSSIDFTNTNSSGFYNSIQAPHTYIHVQVAGTNNLNSTAGDLSDSPFGAFDPIFWLHHSFIDRLWAGWQTTNGNHADYSSVLGEAATMNCFKDSKNNPIKVADALIPSNYNGYDTPIVVPPPALIKSFDPIIPATNKNQNKTYDGNYFIYVPASNVNTLLQMRKNIYMRLDMNVKSTQTFLIEIFFNAQVPIENLSHESPQFVNYLGLFLDADDEMGHSQIIDMPYGGIIDITESVKKLRPNEPLVITVRPINTNKQLINGMQMFINGVSFSR
jgi:hypothetical protein